MSKAKATGCEACPLNGCIKVLGNGPDKTEVVIVGEAPGTTELRVGVPFIGQAGQILDNVLKQASLKREDCYITNSVLCMTNPIHTPKITEVNCCNERLKEEVKAREPKLIIALGKIAMRAILGTYGAMKEERGKITFSDEFNCNVLVTYHPAAIIREPRLQSQLFKDIVKARELLQGIRIQLSETPHVEYEVIDNLERLDMFLSDTERYPDVAVDVEVAKNGRLICVGVSVKPWTATVFAGDALWYGTEKISQWFADKRTFGHNFKFDIKKLWEHGFKGVSTGGDTMLQSYVMDMSVGGHGLKQLVREHLDFHDDYSAEAHSYNSKGYEFMPRENMYKYNAHDAALTFLLENELHKKTDSNDRRVLNDLLYPASDVLAEMEYLGIMVDEPYLRTLEQNLRENLDDVTWQMQEIAGIEFNPNSHKQLVDVMYNRVGLPVPTKMSTDVAALKMIYEVTKEPFPKLLLCYRSFQKSYATYVKGILGAVDENNRVHTTYNLHTTLTGRLSSSRPVNLQNLTRGDTIRNIFKATPGYQLFEADLSQAEIRCWCWFSRDEALRRAILSGVDLHTAVASLMHGVPVEQVTKSMRQDAKKIGFGTIYLMSPASLSHELNCTVDEAEAKQRQFFNTYKDGKKWIDNAQVQHIVDGMYLTVFGRKLRFNVVPGKEEEAKRQAVNYPIQNLASDITLLALIRIHRMIKEGKLGNTRLLLTTHDSICGETTEDVVEIGRIVAKEMERDVLDGWVPFESEAKVGTSLGSLKKI